AQECSGGSARVSSSCSSAGIPYDSSNHRPRSINLHFWLQNGNRGQLVIGPSSRRRHIGQVAPFIDRSGGCTGGLRFALCRFCLRRRGRIRPFRLAGLPGRLLIGLGRLLVRLAAVVGFIETGALEKNGGSGAEQSAQPLFLAFRTGLQWVFLERLQLV